MLDQCTECGTNPESLITDVDSCGYAIYLCGPCYRGEEWEE